ncbi:MAG: PleD family two-component system response regulator [Pseudomonadota bacterium]
MTARVLVVDDVMANVKLFEARLTAEYFEVLTAYNGEQALEVCQKERADIVLLDVMMPGMDGFEVCRKLKSNPETHHIPVIMVTALNQPSDKVKGLEAGADDFLSKPTDELSLITRVKNLARLKMLNDEMIMRASTTEQMGINQTSVFATSIDGDKGNILLVEDSERSAERIVDIVKEQQNITVEPDMQAALYKLPDGNFDLVLVSLNMEDADGLRLCSQIRSLERIRQLPILTIVEPGDNTKLLRALEIGVNDYLQRPIEKNELLARVRTQIKRKRFADSLRSRFHQSVEMAITDPLTNLHNRRYMENHMSALIDEAVTKGKPVSVLIADIDYFKLINDTHGHDVGDEVLRQCAMRFRKNTRGIDLTCRYGGEEFVVIMPDTDLTKAYMVAERLRRSIADQPFEISRNLDISVTTSVGISTLDHLDDTPEVLLKRADQALYTAKKDGRNRVVAEAA